MMKDAIEAAIEQFDHEELKALSLMMLNQLLLFEPVCLQLWREGRLYGQPIGDGQIEIDRLVVVKLLEKIKEEKRSLSLAMSAIK